MSFPKPVFRLSPDPTIRQLQEHVRRLTPLDSPWILHVPTADGFRSLLRVRPTGGGRSTFGHDYEVEVRDVDGVLHTFLGPGHRVVTGSATIVDEAEVDLGEYTSGKTVFRTYTYSTDAVPGTWGEWQYSATVPDEDETFVVWPVATVTDGVPHYHNVGMIRILDIKLCQSCT